MGIRKIFSILVTVIAIVMGVVVLLGYFIPSDMKGLESLFMLRIVFINWAVTLAGFATLVAIGGLISMHWRKLRARKNPDRYSIVTLLGFVGTVIFGIWSYTYGDKAMFQQVVNSVQAPIEASLMAVLAVVLALASFRLFQRRRGLIMIVFVISTILFLVLNSGVLYYDDSKTMRDAIWLMRVMPMIGARGILLGIALGSILAGLRVLLSAERPYNG